MTNEKRWRIIRIIVTIGLCVSISAYGLYARKLYYNVWPTPYYVLIGLGFVILINYAFSQLFNSRPRGIRLLILACISFLGISYLTLPKYTLNEAKEKIAIETGVPNYGLSLLPRSGRESILGFYDYEFHIYYDDGSMRRFISNPRTCEYSEESTEEFERKWMETHSN